MEIIMTKTTKKNAVKLDPSLISNVDGWDATISFGKQIVGVFMIGCLG